MAVSYKDIIYTLFPRPYTTQDSNKDGNGKGTFQRYNEVIGSDIDDNIVPDIVNLLPNVIVPSTAEERMLGHLEYGKGVDVVIYGTSDWRRRILQHVEAWYKIRGTKRCVDIMMGMIGVSGVTITEHFPNYGFDSPVTFDDTDRVFDQNCAGCIDVTFTLTGAASISNDLKAAILSVVAFNQPIDVQIRDITYNGSTIL